MSTEVIVPPLIISWRPNGKIVGDFTWVAWATVVSERAGVKLREKFPGFELRDVVVRPSDPPVEVIYPDGVEPLHHLDMTRRLDPLPGSTIEMSQCSECNNFSTYIGYAEQRMGDWDVKTMSMVSADRPRVLGKGLLVSEAEVSEVGIFGLRGPSRFIFCTEAVKEFIETHGYTNCGFREVGETRL